MGRMKIDFNKNWSFYKQGCDEKQIVDLPHDAMLYEKRDASCPNGQNTGYFPGGCYIYEKTLEVSEDDLSKDVALLFEGVYQNATIYLNGAKQCFHGYGYTEFEVELKDLKAGRNLIRVEADNAKEPNSRWYSGSGIYRPVFLLKRNQDTVREVRITTKCISPAVLEISCSPAGAEVEIFDGEDVVYSGQCGEITLEDAKLWSAERPYLYKAVIHTKTDVEETWFGIRRLRWNVKEGFLVNDVPVKLRGGCVHHDNGILGACTYRDAAYRKVRILKEAGYNAIRSAHNPCSRYLLEACDVLGMYVMDEAFDMWYLPKTKNDYARIFEQEYHADLAAMVEKDRNHPCVILYSIGNEISETAQERGIALAREMVAYMHSLDDTRPVTCGVNLFLNGLASKGIGIYQEDGEGAAQKAANSDKMAARLSGSALYNAIMEHLSTIKNIVSRASFADKATREVFGYLDICGYNYGAARYRMDRKKYPNRLIVGSETYLPDLYRRWRRIEQLPNVIGDFVWVSWDYLGEAGIGTWRYRESGFAKPYPMLLADSGAISITGQMGPQMYYSRVAYRLDRELKMAVRPVYQGGEKCRKSPWRLTDAVESWSWRGCEGMAAQVEVYSDDAKIELFLNGVSKGSAKPKYGIARFAVPYEEGTLRAVAYDKKGNVLKECQLTSAGRDKICVRCHVREEEIPYGKSELIYVDISLTDEKGIVQILEDRELVISIEGGATLLGFGNDNPSSEESYVDTMHSTYMGRAQAILKRTDGGEKVTVRVWASENLSECITVG